MATLLSRVEDGYGLVATTAIVGGFFALPIISMLFGAPVQREDPWDLIEEDPYPVVSWSAEGYGAPPAGDPDAAPSDADQADATDAPDDPTEAAEPSASTPGTAPTSEASTPSKATSGTAGDGASTGAAGEGGEGSGGGPVVHRGVRAGFDPNKPAGGGGAGGKKGKCDADHPDIEELGELRYRVARSLVDSYASHPSRLDDLGWISREGDGWEVGGFGCNGLLHQGGLRRGDVVESVNGRAVRNIFQALAAYKALRKEDVIIVQVRRKGQIVSLRYRMT